MFLRGSQLLWFSVGSVNSWHNSCASLKLTLSQNHRAPNELSSGREAAVIERISKSTQAVYCSLDLKASVSHHQLSIVFGNLQIFSGRKLVGVLGKSHWHFALRNLCYCSLASLSSPDSAPSTINTFPSDFSWKKRKAILYLK